MKKLSLWLITLVAILTLLCCPAFADDVDTSAGVGNNPFGGFDDTLASGNLSGTITWSLRKDGTFTISGTGAMNNFAYMTTPWYSDRNSIKTVIIENGITNIGDHAFRDCINLTSVTIPNSVTSIGDYAFYNCVNMTSVTIPNSVTNIGMRAFYECSSLTSVTIPNSVTSIGYGAFSDCDSLKYNTYSNGKYLGNSTNPYVVLMGTSSTTMISFQIHNATKIIAYNAFRKCSSLKLVSVGNNITSIGGWAFCDCSSLTSVTIPNSVTTIGDNAFSGCSSLTSAIIPNGVTTIGQSAFIGCSKLTSVTIPDSVTSIGDSAFSHCSSLASITIPDSVTSIGDWTFYDCSSLTSVTIGNGVTSIGDYAFSGCHSLTDLTIGNGVTSIGDYAFSSCDSLTDLTIPNSVTNIGMRAFSNCDSLTTVTIGNGVTSIGNYAFYDCDGLTSITIPDSVTSIGDSAFSYCSSLAGAYYLGTRAQWNEISIGSNNNYLINVLKTLDFEILAQPVEQTVTEGENAQFIVEAVGRDLVYQWQYSSDKGATWTNSSSATLGYNTGTLTVVGIMGRNGYLYRCQITDSTGTVYYTDAATLTVLAKPFAFDTQPEAQTVKLGQNASFTVAVNEQAKAYRWQYSKDGGNTWLDATSAMTGYKSDTLTLEATKARNGYLLRCKVTDQDGNEIFSEAALLTVEDSVIFTAHPQAETVKLGNRAAFTVEAEGDVKAYQWQYQMVENGPWWNCTQYTMGYNTPVLNVIAAELRQGFLYRCRVTDSNGNKYYSEAAELTVDIPESYAVLSQPKTTWVMPGKTTTFHIATQGEGLTYQWEYHKGVDKTGPEYYWIAMGSTTGCKTDTLTIAGISGSTNRNGWAYRCVVTDPNGYIYTTDYAFLYVAAAQIDAQPEDANVAPGEKAIFHAEVSGEVAKYQWQYSKDGGKSWYNSSSATQGYNTDTLTVVSVSGATNRNGFLYRCIITDSEGNRIESQPAILIVE